MKDEQRKAAVIWVTSESLRYFVTEGDWRRFHGVFQNGENQDPQLQTELVHAVYGPGFDRFQFPHQTIEQIEEAVRGGADLILCGIRDT